MNVGSTSVDHPTCFAGRFLPWMLTGKCQIGKAGAISVVGQFEICGGYSSRRTCVGSTERTRRAGIHVASAPTSAMVSTTPASTNGSFGVAW